MTELATAEPARLPATYRAARTALEECVRVDECKQWQKKAEALASYAKQAEDDELFQMATRIKARAVRRCGELLKEIEAGTNQHTKPAYAGADTSRSAAARDAGLSERQKVTALRVASVPDDEFNGLVESDDPPTITDLAERGKKPSPEESAARRMGDMFKRIIRIADHLGTEISEFKRIASGSGQIVGMGAIAAIVCLEMLAAQITEFCINLKGE